jgi:hypothetical protein
VNVSIQDGIPPSLTCDLWTGISSEAFISFTIHVIDKECKMHEYSLGALPFTVDHTSENIKNMLTSVVRDTLELSPADVYPVITTDCASNMIKCFKLMDDWTHVKCVLHCIHNAVLAGMKGW